MSSILVSGLSDRGLSHSFKGPGAIANGSRGIKKCVGEASLHLQLELNTLGFLNVPSGKNPKVNRFLGCALKTESLRT